MGPVPWPRGEAPRDRRASLIRGFHRPGLAQFTRCRTAPSPLTHWLWQDSLPGIQWFAIFDVITTNMKLVRGIFHVSPTHMNIESTTRPYRQSARAKAAEETAQRILGAFLARMQSDWFEEIRLEDVAADAGVSVQTVIRRFGGKEGLLDASRNRMREEIMSGRELPPGDVDSALASIISEYEEKGELMMRALAQEDRYPQIKSMTDEGRATHRAWVGKVFDPWLELSRPGRTAPRARPSGGRPRSLHLETRAPRHEAHDRRTAPRHARNGRRGAPHHNRRSATGPHDGELRCLTRNHAASSSSRPGKAEARWAPLSPSRASSSTRATTCA